MAYPGLILANAALGEGVAVDLFFTFWGFDMITKSRMNELKFTMLGNTATHMPRGLGGLPGMTAMATHQMRKQIHDVGVPDVPEFLDQIVDSGGQLRACRLSAEMMHLDESDLYDKVEGIISASDFIEKTAGAQLLFI
jgi:peroxiredoxin family protein